MQSCNIEHTTRQSRHVEYVVIITHSNVMFIDDRLWLLTSIIMQLSAVDHIMIDVKVVMEYAHCVYTY